MEEKTICSNCVNCKIVRYKLDGYQIWSSNYYCKTDDINLTNGSVFFDDCISKNDGCCKRYKPKKIHKIINFLKKYKL